MKHLSLAIIGAGNVGAELLRQLHQQKAQVAQRGISLRVIIIATRRFAIVQPRGIDLSRWREAKQQAALSPKKLADVISRIKLANVAVVDCTADQSVVNAYAAFVKAGCHIVTPNKLANVLPWNEYNSFRTLLHKKQKRFCYEANVGAGLPVLSTLQDLLATGDQVLRIEGTMSGTLSVLFNTFDGRTPFSELVRDAHARGFTEPDPCEDLSGNDVARKLLILARETGLRMNLQNVRVQSLVPPMMRRGNLTNAFYQQLARYDDAMLGRLQSARKQRAVLRYVGTLRMQTKAKGVASARLRVVPRDHPFATARGSESIFVFTTERYSKYPLVIRGAGAGAPVTAMGVFSDILKLV